MILNDSVKLIMKRPPLYNPSFPIILFWSQKSGCTSLAKWFFFQINLLEEALKYHPFIHVYKDEVYYNKENLIKLKNALLKQDRPTLKLVRNPYSRAVSSFLHVIKYHTSSGTPFFEQLKKLYKQNKIQGITFKQFLYTIKDIGSDLNLINGHVAKQYVDGEEQWVHDYVKLEDFDTQISKLEKSHSLAKSPLETIVQSNHHHSLSVSLNDQSFENYSEKLLTRDMLLKENVPTYKSFYDQETLELCRELYMEDFKTYHYTLDYKL